MHTVFNENVRITIKPKLNEKQKHTKKKTCEIKPQRGVVVVERGEIICSMQGKIKKSNYVHPLSSG